MKIIMIIPLFIFLINTFTGCDTLPLRNENAEDNKLEKILDVKNLISNCYALRKEKPENISLKFKIFKSGALSSYGILEDRKGHENSFFQVLEPSSNNEESNCVRYVIKDIEFKLTDFRMSEEMIEIRSEL